jgi:hypothetical protein
MTLTALQASINAPTTAFRGCLKEATTKATSEKIAPEAIEEYLRAACTVQMQSLKSAVIAFRMKNGMSRKAAADDADMTTDDYLSTPADNYKFMATLNAPKQNAAAAPAPAQPAQPAQPASGQAPKP